MAGDEKSPTIIKPEGNNVNGGEISEGKREGETNQEFLTRLAQEKAKKGGSDIFNGIKGLDKLEGLKLKSEKVVPPKTEPKKEVPTSGKERTKALGGALEVINKITEITYKDFIKKYPDILTQPRYDNKGDSLRVLRFIQGKKGTEVLFPFKGKKSGKKFSMSLEDLEELLETKYKSANLPEKQNRTAIKKEPVEKIAVPKAKPVEAEKPIAPKEEALEKTAQELIADMERRQKEKLEKLETAKAPAAVRPEPEKENPEDVEKKWQESLRESRSKVEEARNEYAQKHWEKTGYIERLKGIISIKKFKANEVPEVNAAYTKYREALNNLLQLKIKDLKERTEKLRQEGKIEAAKGQEEIEMGNLVKYFNYEEKINLYEARTNVKNKLWEKFSGTIDGYRKLSWKKKLLISAGFFAVGGVAALVGRRILSGTAAAFGIVAAGEALKRRKEQAIAEKGKEELLTKLEGEGENKFSKLIESLKEEIGGLNQDLNKELQSHGRRWAVGITVGMFIGSGAMSNLVHSGFDYVKNIGFVKDASNFLFHGIGESWSESLHGPEHIETSQVVAPHAGEPPIPEGVPAYYNLTVAKGSSIEGTLIKALEANNINKEEAGRMAHRMVLAYAGEHNMTSEDLHWVKPGMNIRLVPGEGGSFKIGELDMEKVMEKPPVGAIHETVTGPGPALEPGIVAEIEVPEHGPSELPSSGVGQLEQAAYNEWQGGHQKDIAEASKLLQKYQALKYEDYTLHHGGLDPTDPDSMARLSKLPGDLESTRYFSEKSLGKVFQSAFEGNHLGINNLADASHLDASEFLSSASHVYPPDISVLRIGALAEKLDIKPISGETLDKFITRLMLGSAGKI